MLGVLAQISRERAPAGAAANGPATAEQCPPARRPDQMRACEVARVLNVPVKEVYAAVRDERLPATRTGRFLGFRRDDVDAFARRMRRRSKTHAPNRAAPPIRRTP